MTSPTDPVLRPIALFAGARDAAAPAERLREVRARARRFRAELLDRPPVRYYASFGLIRVPYPTKYAFRDAFALPIPFLHILNRLFVVQVDTEAGTKTLLLSPSDARANAETPFFKRIARSMGPLEGLGTRLLGPELATVEQCLAKTGILPEQVDYISYDHLHTQDVRRWLGPGERTGLFPNAKLLVMRQEWQSAGGLLPTQQDWYCPGGLDGVHPSRVVQLDGDTAIGEGFALIRTPGHTEGNHSFVARTSEGVLVTSENGVGPDAYAPRASRVPGVARYAERTGAEVVLNGNTLEGSVDQYISMVQEKEIAGPSTRNPDFPNVVSSSEAAAYWAFSGFTPTFSFGELELGVPVRAGGRA
jgi:hypothetical protein